MQVICLQEDAFYALLDKVYDHSITLVCKHLESTGADHNIPDGLDK